MKSYLSFLFGVLFLLACSHEMPIENNGKTKLPQWPMFRHDVRHTGNVNNDPYEGIVGPRGPNVSVKWSFDSQSPMVGSPAIDKDGTIYFGTTWSGADSVFFYAVNADGALKWKSDDFGRGGTNSSPAIANDGTIYCSSRIGTFAFNSDGSLKWKFGSGFDAWSAPALGSDGTIYWCDFRFLNALNPNGAIKWQLDGGSDWHHPVVSTDGVIYYNHFDRGSLMAVNADGSIRWEYADTTRFRFDAAVIDGAGSIYFLSSAGTLYSVDNAGHLKWKIPRLGTIKEINAPAIAPDGTIVAVGDQFLHAISADGRQLWRREVHYVNSPPLIDAGGNIYLAYHVTAPERITCYTIAGVLKWRITELPNVSIIGGTPLGPDGILIFGSENDGLLYALH